MEINIEVAYAKPDEQMIVNLNVAISTTVEQAIKESQILIFFPEIDLQQNKIGIFSKPCKLDTLLRDNDRVEIYRPLIADPKEARRKKAKQRELNKI
ncbi:MAG: RnfH family protein [Candidatus Marithrix sp.]|nr:RnfH family protein [Candidatus Marithrix sp.]